MATEFNEAVEVKANEVCVAMENAIDNTGDALRNAKNKGIATGVGVGVAVAGAGYGAYKLISKALMKSKTKRDVKRLEKIAKDNPNAMEIFANNYNSDVEEEFEEE